MNKPLRLRNSSSEAPAGLRKLLIAAQPTRSMNRAELERSNAHWQQLMSANESAARLSVVRATNQPIRYLACGFAAILVGALTIGIRNQHVSSCEPSVEPLIKHLATETDLDRKSSRVSQKTIVTEFAQPKASGMNAPPMNSIGNTDSSIHGKTPGSNTHQEESPHLLDIFDPAERVHSTRPLIPTDAAVLLVEAKRYLDEKNPTAALARIEKYTQSFPTKSLSIDAEFIAMDALIQLGRSDEALARGTELLKTTQGTADEALVQEKLAGIGKQNQRLAERDEEYDIILSPLTTALDVQLQDRTAWVLLRGVGNWQFETTIHVPAGIGKTYRAIVFGDFDNDGRTDLAAVSRDMEAVWRGIEGGGFGEPIIAGVEMEVEFEDQEENDLRLADQRGVDVAAKSDRPFRDRILVDDKNEFLRGWIYRWDAMGVEFMLDSASESSISR